MQQLLVALCHTTGYDAIVAGTAEDGFEKAVLFRPDAILLDIVLPGMRGHEMLRHLRDHAVTRDIPVIIVSGTPVGPRDEWSAMASAVLRKPFSVPALQSTLAAVVKRA